MSGVLVCVLCHLLHCGSSDCSGGSWHPYLPVILSTSWLSDGGVVLRHSFVPPAV